MSALDDKVSAFLDARRTTLSHCERAWGRGHPDDAKEHRRQVALGATQCLTTADVILLRLRALGVDVTQARAALDAAAEAILRAAIPVLVSTPADTEEQARGRSR